MATSEPGSRSFQEVTPRNPEDAAPLGPPAPAYRPLASPGFLASIALLLLNDFVLKPVFHNWVTGKLSDVAGIFAFAMFWMVLLPSRRTFVCLSIAGLFAYWKSPYSASLLDGWNSLGLFTVGRTVDYSDLLAIPVVALAHRYYWRARGLPIRRMSAIAIGMAAIVVFVATSVKETSHHYDRSYSFSISAEELQARLDWLEYGVWPQCPSCGRRPEEVKITIPWSECSPARAYVRVDEASSGSKIRLFEIVHGCLDGSSEDRERSLRIFETTVIDRLREPS